MMEGSQLGQILAHESAHVLGNRNAKSGRTRTDFRMQLRIKGYVQVTIRCPAPESMEK